MAPLTRTPDENGRTTPGLLSNNPRVAFFEWAAVHTNKLSLENASNTFFQVYLTPRISGAALPRPTACDC